MIFSALIHSGLLYVAGTRYKRRGVDTDGHVANYVETEQILVYHHYVLSFLQVCYSHVFIFYSIWHMDLIHFK